MGFAIYMKQPTMMTAFLTSPAGMLCLLIVLVLQILGVLMIRKIINIDV